ncbi:tetratricopeptide repeat protein [Sphingomonas sp. S2-65]|uniref:tetratricopeptide repeat protein n=1 Tax=Sphingomonas sp. S2-65 TaxID=2903960 RepID=UPI001F1B20F5|nr:tetratricopeptide repeat protein [Sphingomonas sp. S2-65]UYY59442.1 tetratricopeptide repeat protein [Sphingomonas sp. S2-65]
MRFVALALVPLVAAAAPALAQDRVATTQISQGAYQDAESRLVEALRADPNRPELLINLAAVYARTGREDAARLLYTRVLSQSDVLMDLSSGRTAGSHMIATSGLHRLQPVQFSAR